MRGVGAEFCDLPITRLSRCQPSSVASGDTFSHKARRRLDRFFLR